MESFAGFTSVTFPPLPPHCYAAVITVVSCMTLPLPVQQHLLLAGVGCTQQIRMEETIPLTTMKLASYVISDSYFLTFFIFTFKVFFIE
jgi:hypothetical protein